MWQIFFECDKCCLKQERLYRNLEYVENLSFKNYKSMIVMSSYYVLVPRHKDQYPLNQQKQSSRGVLRKRCSKYMQQIYRRTSMPKCDFKKVGKQLYWNRTSAWMFSCNFAAYFQTVFSKEQIWVAASKAIIACNRQNLV